MEVQKNKNTIDLRVMSLCSFEEARLGSIRTKIVGIHICGFLGGDYQAAGGSPAEDSPYPRKNIFLEKVHNLLFKPRCLAYALYVSNLFNIEE